MTPRPAGFTAEENGGGRAPSPPPARAIRYALELVGRPDTRHDTVRVTVTLWEDGRKHGLGALSLRRAWWGRLRVAVRRYGELAASRGLYVTAHEPTRSAKVRQCVARA